MLTCTDLACVRGERRLFEGVSFSLSSGEWLQLEGENGAGKTSTLRIVAGLLEPDAGEVGWNGKPTKAVADEYHESLLYLGHAAAIKEELTAIENLRINAAIAGQPLDYDVAMDALSRFGLRGREDLPARVLSQGQKRRVALARLLTNPSPLWVLDEPFVALDVRAVAALSGIIEEHLRGGGMALFTSHQEVSPGPGGRKLRIGA